MCVPSPEHTLRTLSTNRRGEGEAPPPAPSTYTPRRPRPAPARLTTGPCASVSATGGGRKEVRGRKEQKTRSKEQRGRERWRWRWRRRRRRLLRVWGGGVGRGGGVLRTRRGRKAGPSCVSPWGRGEPARARLSAESCGPAYLSTHPAPSPRGRSVNPSPPRWAVLRVSGFLRANYPPRARVSRPLPAAASYAPPVPGPEGRRTREGSPDRFRPSFLDVRERSQNWLPASPTEPSYESQRAAPPRVSATGAVPSGSWSSPTAAALADRNLPRVLAAGSGTPNRPSAGPRSPPLQCFQRREKGEVPGS